MDYLQYGSMSQPCIRLAFQHWKAIGICLSLHCHVEPECLGSFHPVFWQGPEYRVSPVSKSNCHLLYGKTPERLRDKILQIEAVLQWQRILQQAWSYTLLSEFLLPKNLWREDSACGQMQETILKERLSRFHDGYQYPSVATQCLEEWVW